MLCKTTNNTPTSLAVLILFALAQVSFSQQCTPETCPDSPVIIEFKNNDCSGAREYYSLTENGFKWGQCHKIRDFYRKIWYTDTYLASAIYDGSNCDTGLEYPSRAQIRHFGVCFDASGISAHLNSNLPNNPFLSKRNSEGGPTAYMYLRNATKQISPQVPIHKPNMPYFDGDTLSCKNYQDCASKGFCFIGKYDRDCNGPPVSFQYPNITANKCYATDRGYTTYSCSNKQTLQAFNSRNADCSLPFSTDLFGSDCGLEINGALYCNAGA